MNFSVELANARLQCDTTFMRSIFEKVLNHGWKLTYRRHTTGFGNPHEWVLEKSLGSTPKNRERETVKIKIRIDSGVIMMDRTRVETHVEIVRYVSRKETLALDRLYR